MKKFVKDFLLYMLPFFILIFIYLLFVLTGYAAGEYKSIKGAIVKQRKDHTIILGLAYNEQKAYYKLENVNYYQKEVIALGTSRVMQFKDVYFKNNFYNCGGAVSGNFDEYRNFLQNMTYKPKVILLGLDTWIFNEEWSSGCDRYEDYTEIQMIDRKRIAMTNHMIRDYIDGKWSYNRLETYSNNIGFNGKIKDSGFMYDGSYYYGSVYRHPETERDSEFKDTMVRMENGNRGFEYGDQIDNRSIGYLEEFLDYCSYNNIYVVGYLTPFAPMVYQEMKESGNYEYLEEIPSVCDLLFKKYGFHFFDYKDGGTLGVTDAYFIDGFHGSEVLYGMLMKDMSSNDNELKQYVDTAKLETLLSAPYNELLFEQPSIN